MRPDDRRRHHFVETVQLIDPQFEAVAPHRCRILRQVEQPHADLVFFRGAGERAIEHEVQFVLPQHVVAQRDAPSRRFSATGAITSNQRNLASAAAISWLSDSATPSSRGERAARNGSTPTRRRLRIGAGATVLAACARAQAPRPAGPCLRAPKSCEWLRIARTSRAKARHPASLQRVAAARELAQGLRPLAHIAKCAHQDSRGALVRRIECDQAAGNIGARIAQSVCSPWASLSSASSSWRVFRYIGSALPAATIQTRRLRCRVLRAARRSNGSQACCAACSSFRARVSRAHRSSTGWCRAISFPGWKRSVLRQAARRQPSVRGTLAGSWHGFESREPGPRASRRGGYAEYVYRRRGRGSPKSRALFCRGGEYRPR